MAKRVQLGMLRFFALLFLLPGLGGMIVAAGISTQYLDQLPRMPVPEEFRMTPRNIHGTIVYQTVDEDRKLTLMEDGSVGVFLVGLVLGGVYFRKWGMAQAIGAEEEELVVEQSK